MKMENNILPFLSLKASNTDTKVGSDSIFTHLRELARKRYLSFDYAKNLMIFYFFSFDGVKPRYSKTKSKKNYCSPFTVILLIFNIIILFDPVTQFNWKCCNETAITRIIKGILLCLISRLTKMRMNRVYACGNDIDLFNINQL